MNAIEIMPGVIHIEESYRVYCTLIQGTTLSILWDTGTGKKDLRPYVEQRVTASYAILNSHGHADHTGGNKFFEKVYLAREEGLLSDGGKSAHIADLRPETVFELGNDTAQTVCLAGHTHGSLGLLLSKRRLLLAGDALDPRLQLLGEEACSLRVLKSTLDSVLHLPFDRYLTSHSPALLDRSQIEAHREHLERIDPNALEQAQRAGVPVWVSTFRSQKLCSEFILGKHAKDLSLDECCPKRDRS